MKTDIFTKQLLEKLASSVNEAKGSNIVNAKHCTFIETELAFYSEFKLYTLIDSSYTPLIQYYILYNGNLALLLDGTYRSWNYANQLDTIKLSTRNVLEYVRIVLGTIHTQFTSTNLVTSIDDIDFYQMPSLETLQQIESSIKPPVISLKNNEFTILSCLLEGTILFDCLISVKLSGEISITDKNCILTGIPVAELAWD